MFQALYEALYKHQIIKSLKEFYNTPWHTVDGSHIGKPRLRSIVQLEKYAEPIFLMKHYALFQKEV